MKQPFILTLMSTVTCAATATNKAPENTTPPQSNTPPNILFILCDDMGYGDLGCYGQPFIRTPHIDTMANEGMRFTQAYAGSPVSAPSTVTTLAPACSTIWWRPRFAGSAKRGRN